MHTPALWPGLLWAVAALVGVPGTAGAATDAEIKLIVDGVKSRYPHFDTTYCKQPDDDRRKVTTQVTMELAMARRLKDPVGAGPAAGALLRKACGIDEPAAGAAIARWATSAAPLVFSNAVLPASSASSVAAIANQLVVPTGVGPFPAVVLNHTIGGATEHLLAHARSLLAAGFAVMVVDSYGPRGLRAGQLLLPSEVAKDAYGALAHLQRMPQVRGDRVFQAGFSLGALASALLASPESAKALQSAHRFHATAGWYGGCAVTSTDGAQRLDMLTADSDKPVLLLMAEQDIETPPALCFPLLDDMKAAGKDVVWHVFPNTTHGWDKPESNGYVYRKPGGGTMTYRYDPGTTQDATARMLAFFRNRL
jgi:dienelactone hydrolase